MSFKLKFFGVSVLKRLKSKVTLKTVPVGIYSQYLSSEYSRMRLTHDIFDNHYFREFSGVSLGNEGGVCYSKTITKRH